MTEPGGESDEPRPVSPGAARRRALVKKLREQAAQRQQLLFGGRWMSAEDVRRTHRLMRRQQWMILVELVLVFGALVFVARLAWTMLTTMIGR